jgi:RimJ/RimL family protein N-acetyltransferase
VPTEPQVPTLRAPGLRLEPLQRQHAAALFPLLSDPLLYTHLDYGPPPSLAHLENLYQRLEARRSPDGAETWLNWAVMDERHGAGIGYVQATVIAGGRAWVAYVLGRAHWGRGHGRASTAAMIEHLAREYGVMQCLACAERANRRSLALLESLGFRPASPDEAAKHELSASEVLYLRSTAA